MKVRIDSFTTIRSGLMTSRMLVRARSRRMPFIATRLRASRSTSSKTASPGSGMSNSVRANGREPALRRQDALEPPGHDVGERQEPQRLAGGRAVHDHAVELALLVVALDPEQREQLVHARRDGQLLRRDAVDAALGQQVAEPALHAVPVALHLLLRLDLLAEQVARRRAWARRRARPRASRTGCAPGRSRGRRCAGRRRRSGARSRRRRSSCRLRPCPCRGSCAAPSARRTLVRA